jgi:hypothetical protein
LQVFCFGIEPVPNDRHDYPAKRSKDALLKIHNVDQPVFRVAIILLRNAIAQGLRLGLVLAGHHRKDGNVAIGGRELVLIDIGKRKPVSVSDAQLRGWKRCGRKESDEEKILPEAEDHA